MRFCSNPECRAPILECMGFVKAGDFLEFATGVRPQEDVRELCGKCGLFSSFPEAEGRKEAFFKKIGWI